MMSKGSFVVQVGNKKYKTKYMQQAMAWAKGAQARRWNVYVYDFQAKQMTYSLKGRQFQMKKMS